MPRRIAVMSERSDVISSVSCQLSRSSWLTRTAAGRPFRVMTMRSSRLSTSSMSSLSFAFTSESGSVLTGRSPDQNSGQMIARPSLRPSSHVPKPRIAHMPRAASRASAKKPARTVTRAFLFSDLRGYTDFVEAHGDAAAVKLLRDYRTLVRGEVARHRGAEVKTEGDSFYVVFESPSAALDCAVAILRKARTQNEANTRSALNIGVGLHAGETIAEDTQFVGSTVNVASRLASRAGAGELLISDTLRGLVRTG